MMTGSYHTVWASILAFACILFVLGLLLCIPFCLARVRGMHPRVDRVMDLMARWMGATPPTDPHKGSQQPAPRSLLRALKVIRYVKPNDPEAGAEDCCAICCCEYEAGQPTIKLSCSHLFHKECIISWLKVDAVCPICKTHLLPSAEGASADGCYCRPVQTASPEAAEAAATQPALVTGAGQGQGSQAGQQAPDSPSRMQMSPRLGVIALQPCALSVPMVGVAGVSP